MEHLNTALGVISQITYPNVGFWSHHKFVITVCKMLYAKFRPGYHSD